MVSPVLDMRSVRAAVERVVDELGPDAFVYTVEPKDAGWELRVECAVEEGWQVITLPVDPGNWSRALATRVHVKGCERHGSRISARASRAGP